jgi:tripeptide aminopeptidase
MLTSHMDTVPICVGSKPVKRGRHVRSADSTTGLGADDRAGVAATLNAALEIVKRRLPHPPLTFCWFIQEEVGLFGARHVRKSSLGSPQLAFNWDGGAANKLTVGATGGYRLQIWIQGRASHAGAAPEKGVSAIAIASLAIASLVRDGWHGDIQKDGRRGTSNVGIIQGGDATNVVTEKVYLKAEARSHDPTFRQEIVGRIEAAFRQAAEQVRSSEGVTGSVVIKGQLDYESFKLPDDQPCVLAAEGAIRALGRTPVRAISNGGLDANWLSARGIPTVSLGCGQLEQHTTREALDLDEFHQACRVALRLATATENLGGPEANGAVDAGKSRSAK